MSAPLLVISCGGTFDKAKFTRAGKFVCGAPAAAQIFALAGVAEQQCEIASLLRKDSLDMDEADRERVVAAVRQAVQRRIVVVHGTDTLLLTAQRLAAAGLDKTVVLVGAMRPAVFTGTDAQFNLGFALAAATLQPSGTWVAMHGRLWPADQVRKDAERQRFADKD